MNINGQPSWTSDSPEAMTAPLYNWYRRYGRYHGASCWQGLDDSCVPITSRANRIKVANAGTTIPRKQRCPSRESKWIDRWSRPWCKNANQDNEDNGGRSVLFRPALLLTRRKVMKEIVSLNTARTNLLGCFQVKKVDDDPKKVPEGAEFTLTDAMALLLGNLIRGTFP